MDDLRVAWMKERVYAGLYLSDHRLFTDLLVREDGRASRDLTAMLESETELLSDSIIFYPLVTELEREVEVEEGEEKMADTLV